MRGALLKAVSRRPWTPLLLLLVSAAAVCRAERSTGAPREAAGSPTWTAWTAWRRARDPSGAAGRCAEVCGAAAVAVDRDDERRRGSGSDRWEGSFSPKEEECAVDLRLSDFAEDARVIGVELGLGLLNGNGAPFSPESLRVYVVEGALDVEYYSVFEDQR